MQSRQLRGRERERFEGPEMSDTLPDGRRADESAGVAPATAPAELRRAWAERRAQMSAALARSVELWRPSEAEVEEAQMCALVNFGERMPRDVAVVLATAIRKARHDAGKRLPSGECLVRIAQHFVNVWRPLLNERSPPRPR